jgi:hypothetical protein
MNRLTYWKQRALKFHVYDGSLCVVSDGAVKLFIRDWRSGRQLEL